MWDRIRPLDGRVAEIADASEEEEEEEETEDEGEDGEDEEVEVVEVMGADDEGVGSGRFTGLMAITGRPGYLVQVHEHVTHEHDAQALRKR